jgi:Putative adhesin
MIKRLFRLSVVSAVIGLTFAVTASAQDFEKSYRIGAGGQVSIANVSGDVIVTAYDGDAIIVRGIKKGRDRDRVEIEDRSSGSRVDVGARYPKECNCDASIRFEVRVPRSVSYNFDGITSVSGDVDVSGVTGRLRASAVSGDVKVKNVSGSASVTSVSGDVEVEVDRLDGSDDMKFSSVSGDVVVRMPSNLDADVDISSLSGSIKTDFPIEVREERHGTRTYARGRLGSGSRRVNMSSVSGDLSLNHF